MTPLISFEHVCKRYDIASQQLNLREALARIPRRVLRSGDTPEEATSYIWALKNVDFEARVGDVIGIIGHNGAGKTTLLKLISRVTEPTDGNIDVRGRISALIELGAGFHPDLTGRENIYLNGVILGLSRRDVARKFASIVEFAELEKFIDTPVKRYSSGMYARLGFAVAAHTEPDLLLIDEVLGVGDQSFQQKCHEFIHSFVTGSKAALFVSHNLYVIEQLCNRLIWLDRGEIVMTGRPRDVLPRYFDSVERHALRGMETPEARGDKLRLVDAALTDAAGNPTEAFVSGQDIIVALKYETASPIRSPLFSISVTSSGNAFPLFTASMLVDGQAPRTLEGTGTVRCRFKGVPLMPRVYEVWCEVWGEDRTQTLVVWRRLGSFRVVDPPERAAAVSDEASIRHLRADALLRMPYEWDF